MDVETEGVKLDLEVEVEEGSRFEKNGEKRLIASDEYSKERLRNE